MWTIKVGAVALAMMMAATAMAGCGGRAQTVAPPPGSSLSWHPCTTATGPLGVECSSLRLPIDSSGRPGGGPVPSVTIALDRIPASGTRLGSLVFNPGGPGVSAVDELPSVAGILTPGLRQHFDLIGFDPPGVGHSSPISCLSPQALAAYEHQDPSPPGSAGVTALVATNQRLVAACEAAAGAELTRVGTLDAARDLDRVRAALGDSRLTYLGFSYGTLLGATYAALFPTHVRAMVLDGAIDPAIDPLQALVTQSAAVDAQFATFAVWCRTHTSSCPWRPAGPAPNALLALVAASRRAPFPAGHGRQAGPAELLYGTAAALYSPDQWPVLGRALAALDHADGAGIVTLFDQYMGRTSTGALATTTESETAVNCDDRPSPTLAEVGAATARAAVAAPIFGPLNVEGDIPCALWPAHGDTLPMPLRATGAPPIVVVGSTGDPITPYQWAQGLVSALPGSRLLTRIGDGHTAYPYSSCVRAAVQQYLVGLVLPAAGLQCRS